MSGLLLQTPAADAVSPVSGGGLGPIGSGLVESAHKVVMQARLKGAGMHWEESNVNPLLALRSTISSDRWDETWQQQERYQYDARELWRAATAVLATSDIRSEEMGYVPRTAQGATLSCWFLSHLPKKEKV